MIILCVDDERLALEGMMSSIRKAEPDAEINGFLSPRDAMDYLKEHSIDVAFLDIEMGDISGVDFAKKIKKEYPKANIIFTTGYSSYQGEAFAMHASGYILKPVTKAKVEQELENLRYPVEPVKSGKRVRIHCFGNFEAYIDDAPIKFKYEKTKEMLAVLVDRDGAFCSNGEIMAFLWEDEDHESYLRNIKQDLKNVFEEKGIVDIVISERGKSAINKEAVDCDLYDMQAGDVKAINAYRGEYMEQYTWGELSKGYLL